MNWQVSSSIYGGHQSSPATQDEYRRIARALDDAGARLQAQSGAWDSASLRLAQLRTDVPLCPAFASGAPPPSGHATLPFDRLTADCQAHAASCTAYGDELRTMAALLVRAHSLYSQAEADVRRTVTELVQAGVQISPKYAAIAAGAIAAGGAIGGSVAEGAFSPIYALTSTAWAQEGLMSGAGAAVAGIALGEGTPRTDEVNAAADRIAAVSAPGYDQIQGGVLTVREVRAQAEAVRSSASVADALENLRRLGEERLGRIDLGSGLSHGTIAIQRYRTAEGGDSWLVTVPGTDGNLDSPFGWPQNVELMSDDPAVRMEADSARMVVRAMEMAGIGPDEPVAIVGHSQGGIVAAAIASDMADRYDIRHVVTAGSPVANHPIPDRTWVTSIEIDDELVAALDGAENPASEHWMTVRGTVSRAPSAPPDPTPPGPSNDGSCPAAAAAGLPAAGMAAGAALLPGAHAFDAAPVAGSPERKEISHWLGYHQAAYRNATDLGSPAVATHERHFQSIVTGDLQETRYFEGRMSRGVARAPAARETEPVAVGG